MTDNYMTVDLEDYFQVEAFARVVPRDDWPRYETRFSRNSGRLLDILASRGVRATFFVLGWCAVEDPGLVRAIDAAGHEIASHGYWHRPAYDLSPDAFREDARRSKRALEDILSKPVIGFRAPTFSVIPRTAWALDVLAEEGYLYDSSVFPIHHDRYGWPGFSTRKVRLANGLTEYPLTVWTVGRRFNVPVGGGGYFRIYPYGVTRRLLRRVNEAQGRPFVFYLHPWEIDPGQPAIGWTGVISRWRHRANIAGNDARFRRLLEDFRFRPFRDDFAATARAAFA